MRLLCLSDIHDDVRFFRPDLLPRDVDRVLVAGDITNCGRSHRAPGGWEDRVASASAWIDGLKARYGKSRVHVVAGNHDIALGWQELGQESYLAPGETFTPDEMPATFDVEPRALILGASLCTAFDRPETALSWAHTTAERADDARFWTRAPAAHIVLSHCPPCGPCAVTTDGRDIGSPGLEAYILYHKPALVVCGHVHNRGGSSYTIQHRPAHTHGEDDRGQWTLVVNTARQVTLADMMFDPTGVDGPRAYSVGSTPVDKMVSQW